MLGTSTFSVPFITRLLPDSTAELHFVQSVFCWWCTCRSVSSCLSQPCSISTPDKLWPPWFSLCLPRQCICLLFWLPVSASTLHMFLFCLSSFSEESHVQSGGLLLCPLIFLHVGKPRFCALRREFRKMTGCCGLLCSFLGQSAYHSLSKPQLYWCESRVFRSASFFPFLLQDLTLPFHDYRIQGCCWLSYIWAVLPYSWEPDPAQACSVPASKFAPSAC